MRGTFSPFSLIDIRKTGDYGHECSSNGTWNRAHTLCDDYGDVASASLIQNWIDEAEHRVWFLYEATRHDCEKQE